MKTKAKTAATPEEQLAVLLPAPWIGKMTVPLDEEFVIMHSLQHVLPKLPMRVLDVNDPNLMTKHVVAVDGEELHLLTHFRKLRAAQKEVTRMITTTYSL